MEAPPTDAEIEAFDNRDLGPPAESPAGSCALYSLDACEDVTGNGVCESCGWDIDCGGVTLVPTHVGVACALLCEQCADVGRWPTWNRNLPTSTERVITHARHVLLDADLQAGVA